MMEGLSFTNNTRVRPTQSVLGLWTPGLSRLGRPSSVSFLRRHRKFVVFASKDEPKLDPWDQMELKFGRLLGEDPKLTLAKIMGRKSNPDMSSLEIEKLFSDKKGKVRYDEIKEIPFDVSQEKKSSSTLDALNLVKPMPRKGVKFETDGKPIGSEEKKQAQSVPKAVGSTKSIIPNVILRKPVTFKEDDAESFRFRPKPNFSLKMGEEPQKEHFSDMTLLRKPEPMSKISNSDEEESSSASSEFESGSPAVSVDTSSDFSLQGRPEIINQHVERTEEKDSFRDRGGSNSVRDVINHQLKSEAADGAERNLDHAWENGGITHSRPPLQENDSVTGTQPVEQSDSMAIWDKSASYDTSMTSLSSSCPSSSMEAALQGKPKRLDLSMKETLPMSREDIVLVNTKSSSNAADPDNRPVESPMTEHEDTDWARAEELAKTGKRGEVELIRSSMRGFVVSFGSLIGILPYKNLATKWKFLAFESWLRRKGIDPSIYRKNLGVIGSHEAVSMASFLNSTANPALDHKVGGILSQDMKLEELLQIYEQEKLKFLSSFVGQKIGVSVALADRKSRRLVVSMKPKENEALVEKKRNLMAKLSIGDIVKCSIKKITYVGIFVEVNGVPALIHQSEVSWDSTLDPSSYFKISQIVEAKVHQLDFSLERIFLSLKEITPDPLMDALDAVVGYQDFLDGKLEVAEADSEWTEMESLIEELRQFEGIQSVCKGRYLLSPGLAPTFQVYMASMFENQYKLLARSGNKVQEVIVQTSLGKEEFKNAILTCTNKVE